MKKIFSMILCIAMLVSVFAVLNVSAAAVPEDGTGIAVTKADVTLNDAEVAENPFQCSDANTLSYISAGDSFTFAMDFAKAGAYKAVAPIASPNGAGKYDVYVDDVLAYTATIFTASGTNQWNIYAEESTGYFEIKEAGTHTIKYVFVEAGFNFTLPTISYAGETMPEWVTDLKKAPVYLSDGMSESPAKAVHMNVGHYYAVRVNIGSAFRGFGFSQWTTGKGYNGHVAMDMSVYAWDEDFYDNYEPLDEFSYASDPIATRNIPTTQNGYIGVVFDEIIPAGEYLLVINVTDSYNDDPEDTANQTPWLHIRTGVADMETYDDDWESYFEGYTNATEYAVPPDRWAEIDIYAVEEEVYFYELGELLPGATPVPTATPDPNATQAPTQAPATQAPTQVPATEAPKATDAPAKEEEGGCGSSMAIAHAMLILGAAVIMKKKK